MNNPHFEPEITLFQDVHKTSVKRPANSSATRPGREGTSGLCRKQLRGLVWFGANLWPVHKRDLAFFFFTTHFGKSMILDDFEAWPHQSESKVWSSKNCQPGIPTWQCNTAYTSKPAAGKKPYCPKEKLPRITCTLSKPKYHMAQYIQIHVPFVDDISKTTRLSPGKSPPHPTARPARSLAGPQQHQP